MDGLRSGRVFVATGGLIDRLEFAVSALGSGQAAATMGETLKVSGDAMLVGTIRFRAPPSANAGGAVPVVDHVDLIAGAVTGQTTDTNPTTRLVRRFTAADWQRDGEDHVIRFRVPAPAAPGYLRLRGSNTDQAEPDRDLPGEDPWQDLWFYSNPVYLGTQ